MAGVMFDGGSYLDCLPEVLRGDGRILALSTAFQAQARQLALDTQRCIIWARIDALPEEALDTLAYDLKTDWWDYDYTLAEKRQVLRDAMTVHRRMGTRGGVELALRAVYPDTSVQEAADYGGQPFHFRLVIRVNPSGMDAARFAWVTSLVQYYKNVRSIMDETVFMSQAVTATCYAYAIPTGLCGSVEASARLEE